MSISSSRLGALVLFVGSVAAIIGAPDVARAGFDRLCPLLDHEEHRELQDLELSLELARTELRARERVFEMVEALWQVRAVEQEIYLDYRRQRDRTRVRVDRIETEIEQQQTVVAQYDLICDGRKASAANAESTAEIDALNERYRELECKLLGYDVAIAEVDYAFHSAVLEATKTLNLGNVKSKFDLVLDEADAAQAKSRVEGYRRRARGCRAQLEGGG